MITERDIISISKKRAAELLGVTAKFIDRYIADGSLPAVKLGHRTVRIRLKDLDAFMNQRPWRDQ